MTKPKKTHTASAFQRYGDQVALGKDNLLGIIESVLCPATMVLSLWASNLYYTGEISPSYLILAVLVFSLTFPGQTRLSSPLIVAASDILSNWIWVFGLLALTGYATGFYKEFDTDVLMAWTWSAPLLELVAYFSLRQLAPVLIQLQGTKQRAIIVGLNDQGLALAQRIQRTEFIRLDLRGFVESRGADRCPTNTAVPILGKLDQLSSIVRDQRIQVIYLSLPMASQPRILQVLDDLKDTTASIYFVPDMFVTDLIQGRPSAVCGLPVIAVCETPFKGFDGFLKRSSDIIFSAIILMTIFPILLGIGIAVKLGSKGPVIFKQRRYGLDGEEILVYKFRSMTVTENGDNVQQARKNDTRITPLGAILRKTSLDELPQFMNVLQGRMSIVGPRPHAVAHNEMYRKLIKGYMVRHKVKPGITGWAQVNGFRGETETLDKMQGRIDFDLDYLRNWSLRLDIHIILKTVKLVFNDRSAY